MIAPGYVAAREVLLDALDALGEQRHVYCDCFARFQQTRSPSGSAGSRTTPSLPR